MQNAHSSNSGSLAVHIAVAGADGVGVSARSWANAAKAGMKQAAAPQEKARPATFQQIVTINKAKGKLISWHLQVMCACVCAYICVG